MVGAYVIGIGIRTEDNCVLGDRQKAASDGAGGYAMVIMRRVLVMVVLLVGMAGGIAMAAEPDVAALSDGQSIYVPAYSHIYSGDRELPLMLTVTLSIRNTDPARSIKITRVDYYETQGTLLKRYLIDPVVLGPMESLRYVIPEGDKSGGSGANFLVNWSAEQPCNPPVVESIMISTKSQQGISFTSRGQVLVTE